MAGTRQAINWSYTGNPGKKVMIELLKDGVLDSVISNSVTVGRKGSGIYEWIIPSDQATGSDYSIRVTSTSDSNYTDTSEIFTITHIS